MQTLRSILKDVGIDSRESLRAYISRNAGTSSGGPLAVFTSGELHLDSECRTYEDRLSFERAIFDVPCLRIENSDEIEFRDCVFTGQVMIGQKVDDIASIQFDSCVISGQLSISSTHHVGAVSLHSVTAPSVTLNNIGCQRLDVSSCLIGYLVLIRSQIAEFYTFCNSLKCVDIGFNEFQEVAFSHQQVDLFAQSPLPDEHKIERISAGFNEFQFPPEPDLDELSEAERRVLRSQTFQFLAGYSDAGLNRKASGHLKYLQALACQPNWAYRQFQRAVGAFVKPSRLLLVIGMTIVLFGLLFALPVFQFTASGPQGSAVARSLSITEALYFSGTSFTTIGYGDIAPVGSARMWAILEGLLGVVLASSFLVSLVRKYID
jgi:hypothetical protein